MKTIMLASALLLAPFAAGLSAGTLSTLPTTGLITGSPGQLIGWGFSTTNDSVFESISFSQSILINETNPLLGTYSDFIGPQGGPDSFTLPAAQTWSEGFSATGQTGLGSYLISSSAPIGSSDSGTIEVFYNYADSTPGTFEVPFFVLVQQEAPEPGTWALMAVPALILLMRRKRSAAS